MNSPLAPPSPEVSAMLDDGFELALARHETADYMFVQPKHYGIVYDNNPDTFFYDRLSSIIDFNSPPQRILDIGAGNGMFLMEMLATLRTEQGIAINAAPDIRPQYTDASGRLSWVYGDISRPETLQPDNIITPESIDLAVSNLTFMHLTDSLRALGSVLPMLKYGGKLALDGLSIGFTPECSDDDLLNAWETLRDTGLRSKDDNSSEINTKVDERTGVKYNSIYFANATYTKQDNKLYDVLDQFDTHVGNGRTVCYSFHNIALQ